MKNVLAIEIKDNKTIVTLAKIQDGNYGLILHKSYGSRALSKGVYYDDEIINNIVRDLREINILNDIDEKYLTINTNKVSITTINLQKQKFNTPLEERKELFINSVKHKNPGIHICEEIYSNSDNYMVNQNVRATLEAVNIEYIEKIKSLFRAKGIEFTKTIPVIRAIQNSVKSEIEEKDSAISILVEEKFTQLTWIEKGVVSSAVKWDLGLTDIYQHISNLMNINKQEAKQLFASFGSIPPEDVVDDKVIHTRRNGKELEIFTKKDLSRFITEKVQELFANVKHHIDALKHEGRIKIIFNGEIKKLMGFKKFASISFNEPNIKKYHTNIIGLNPETEFITMGILEEVKKETNNKKRKKEYLYTPKVSLLNKLTRMYNYI